MTEATGNQKLRIAAAGAGVFLLAAFVVAWLSRLHFWRSVLATMTGILPASFVLAYFGSVAMAGCQRRLA
ncbi:hypothetical protein [Psychromarinibacter sediminicola]|uniref:hypothetical protein n=1 Tax=Psychromarinibacter sediminicola TaxID=3033385 RepID=UPI0035AB81F0